MAVVAPAVAPGAVVLVRAQLQKLLPLRLGPSTQSVLPARRDLRASQQSTTRPEPAQPRTLFLRRQVSWAQTAAVRTVVRARLQEPPLVRPLRASAPRPHRDRRATQQSPTHPDPAQPRAPFHPRLPWWALEV